MDKRLDRATLVAFLVALTVSVTVGANLVIPLLIGFALFFARGLSKGVSAGELLRASARGIWQSRWVLVVLLAIGAMTALWRSSGTIAALVTALVPLFHPLCLPLMSFLLCCVVSALMGTAFGTAATAGCACMVLCDACQGNAMVVAGAVLAGSYFGDRCSPVSSSALLVAQLTGTNNLRNIAPMLRSAIVPTAVALVVYAILGVLLPGSADAVASVSYESYFTLDAWAFVPAILIIALALAKAPTIVNIAVSTLAAFALTVFLQGASLQDALQWAVFGFSAPEGISSMSGGGVVSMVNAVLIITVASTYAGLMSSANLPEGLDGAIDHGCQKVGTFAITCLVSLATSAVACNQTLGILLTHQLMQKSYAARDRLMLDLENTVVVIAPLIPWSIAGLVPLTMLGAGIESIPFAVLLYAIPLWGIARRPHSRS